MRKISGTSNYIFWFLPHHALHITYSYQISREREAVHLHLLQEALQKQKRSRASPELGPSTAAVLVLCRPHRRRSSLPPLLERLRRRRLRLLWQGILQPPTLGPPRRAPNSRPQIRRMQPIQEILPSRPLPSTFKTQPPWHEWEMDQRPRKRLCQIRVYCAGLFFFFWWWWWWRETSQPRRCRGCYYSHCTSCSSRADDHHHRPWSWSSSRSSSWSTTFWSTWLGYS